MDRILCPPERGRGLNGLIRLSAEKLSIFDIVMRNLARSEPSQASAQALRQDWVPVIFRRGSRERRTTR
jgi:hypothetical protein